MSGRLAFCSYRSARKPNSHLQPPAATTSAGNRARAACRPETTGTLCGHAACSTTSNHSPTHPLHTACRRPAEATIATADLAACATDRLTAHPARTSGARRNWLWNRAHPSLARGWPCRRSSLARLRAPISLRAFQAGWGAATSSAPSATDHRRCEGSSHGAPRAWLPFGPARAFRQPSNHVRSPGDRCCARPTRECGAPRLVAAAQPRFARTTPRPAPAIAKRNGLMVCGGAIYIGFCHHSALIALALLGPLPLP